ncbi:flippase-like domain-containing protein [Candidatus Saccharibacteria bacterium]|nr:flippase-like domain-containing protein [Candidatus Saccharibacteria bacterium]
MTENKQKFDSPGEKKSGARMNWKEFDLRLIRKPILTIIFILLNVGVIVATAVAEFGNSKNAAELSTVHIEWGYLVPATLCFIIAILLEIYKYVLMIKRMMPKDKKYSRKHIYKTAARQYLLGRYYDNITPAAIGGQPYQIYYMRKHSGLPSGSATAIPMFGMVAGQIGFLIIATICFLIGSYTINNAALIGTACFGLIFYAFWPAIVGIAMMLPKGMTEIINKFVKWLAKIHIVKNPKETSRKLENEIAEYTRSIRQITKCKGLSLKVIICSVIFHILISMIPFFVLTAFGGNMDFLPCFVTTVAVTAAVYFIPTPGNSGAAEGTFFVVFSALSTGYVFWAMLLWRFFSYYIYILMGLVLYLIMHLEKKRRKRQV